MKKLYILVIAMLISLLGLTSLDAPVGAVGTGSEAACDNASNNDINPNDPDTEESTPFTYNFDAGAGNIVSGVCIKSGNNMFGDSHSGMLGNGTYENGCYTVSGVGTQFLTVTRNLSSNSCQGISHLDIDVDTAPTGVTPTDVTPTGVTPTDVTPTDVTPTDVTPTDVTPTDVTPTDVTPTPSISSGPTSTPPACEGASCNTGGNSPTPTSPTATPSATVTPTTPAGATATPTGTPLGGITTSNVTTTSAPSVLGASTSPERVLGAATMASTGTFEAIAMTLLGMLGTVLLGAGYLSHKKEQK